MRSKDHRIYVVVANMVRPHAVRIHQPLGRQAAQACHAVSMVRHEMVRRRRVQFKPITTIVLSSRDALELFHLARLLEAKKIRYEIFCDTNEEVYGEGKFHTAIATWPVNPEEVRGVLDHLPLWASEDHLL